MGSPLPFSSEPTYDTARTGARPTAECSSSPKCAIDVVKEGL
jgi:hypothetical protein